MSNVIGNIHDAFICWFIDLVNFLGSKMAGATLGLVPHIKNNVARA